jgi:hypothetical protein
VAFRWDATLMPATPRYVTSAEIIVAAEGSKLVTGALRRPLLGNEIRSGASSQEAARRLATHRLAVASRFVPRRPEKLREAQPRQLEHQAEPEILGLR